MFKAKKTFLVGFSGGADSTAALLWMMEHTENRVIAVHFNHHLRGSESDREAANAAKFAADRNVEFRLIDLDIPRGGNLEARARQARLTAWKNLCAEYDSPVVVTGHHQDDCLENMFLRIGRGSNVSGLTGLQLTAEVDGVKFFRPLLIMSRAEIETFLCEHNVTEWAVDSSNLQCDYSRNVLRNRILPELYQLFPGGRKAVVQSYQNLCDDAACLDRMAQMYYDSADDRLHTSFWRLHCDERAMTVRLLRLLCKEFFGADVPLPSSAVDRFCEMVQASKSGICVLDKKRQLRFAGDRIYPLTAAPETVQWHWRSEPNIRWGSWRFTVRPIGELPENLDIFSACFDQAQLPDVLEIGTPGTGEKMVPFGRKNMVKIKELRIKRKIPAFPAIPVLRIPDGRVLWLPGIRHSGECLMRPKSVGVIISGENFEDFE